MKIKTFHKKHRLHPHDIWAAYCFVFISILTLLLAASSWYFVHTMEHIDAPTTAPLETNAAKIQAMQQSVDRIEKAVELRKR